MLLSRVLLLMAGQYAFKTATWGCGWGQIRPKPASRYPSPNFAEFSSCNTLYRRSAHSRQNKTSKAGTVMEPGRTGRRSSAAFNVADFHISPTNSRPTTHPSLLLDVRCGPQNGRDGWGQSFSGERGGGPGGGGHFTPGSDS